jgi:hypothetical protein
MQTSKSFGVIASATVKTPTLSRGRSRSVERNPQTALAYTEIGYKVYNDDFGLSEIVLLSCVQI